MLINRLPVITVCCLLFVLQTMGQERYWQQELKYDINVKLNDVEHSLDGTLALTYRNNSPDTLNYIWFHIWPNAFKNDRTAFSEQQLILGKTAFYFSGREEKGYINRLNFKSGNISLEMEDDSFHVDIVKVLLHEPLIPGDTRTITTPFHVKLPYNFSRGGHNGTGGQSYQLTQWYPKPAVYDKDGWHPMPYLEQGEFYSNFALYDVKITLPANYVVAATGVLQNSDEIAWLDNRTTTPLRKKLRQPKDKNAFLKPSSTLEEIASDTQTKTLRYLQDSIHDFALFADKYFIVKSSSIVLPSGKNIKAYSFYREQDKGWINSLADLEDAIRFRSALNGDYPYNFVSIVSTESGLTGGMEYPMIAALSPGLQGMQLRQVIQHEVGHNWFSGMLASNERRFPWLDEGINTYYDMRFHEAVNNEAATAKGKQVNTKLHSNNFEPRLLRQKVRKAELRRTDQPVNTASADFSPENYFLFSYQKPADLLQKLEALLGRNLLDSAMRAYVDEWRFRHPQPQDFRLSLEKTANRKLSLYFDALEWQSKGQLEPFKKKIVSGFLPGVHKADSVDYIDILPVPGYNIADGFMIGAAVHNLAAPFNRLHFFVSPMYATRSKQLNGLADLNYSWYKTGNLHKITAGLGFSRFSTLSGNDSNTHRINAGFVKLTPSLKVSFRNPSPLSTTNKWIEWKTYIIGETDFRYNLKESDGVYYPSKSAIDYRYINQLTFALSDERALYPYAATLQLQQAKDFYRVNLNADYYFNYGSSGGLSLRLFAAKFGYIGTASGNGVFETVRYQPKLTAVTGPEDYTYSDYFIGRYENSGFASQQIMMRDGGLKLRTDLFQDLQGRSDNWVTSLNFNSSIPGNILPPIVPLKVFFDIGTYAGAWQEDAKGSRFLYVAGLQLSLFKQVLNIYAPVIYSKTFSDNLKTVPEENKFFKKISFSIDMQRFNKLLSSHK